jgi:PmbA protein
MSTESAESAVKYALSLGFDDAIVTIGREHRQQVKLAMSRIENIFDWDSLSTDVFLAYKKRTMSLGIEGSGNVQKAVENARKRIEAIEPNEDYNGIADKAFRAVGTKKKDREFDLAEEGRRALELSAGLNCSGVVEGFMADEETATSAGAVFTDANEFYRACIRLYSDVETSGQSVECSERLDMERCVNEARAFAEKAKNPERADAGTYEVLYAPLAFSNLMDSTLGFSSIYSVESGMSFLAGKDGEEVAVSGFGLYDDATLPSVNRRAFDDEGVKTRRNAVIEGGVLKTYLYNTTYARKYGKESTGNAGVVSPTPWCGDVREGTESVEDLVAEIKKGIIITNTWYTRFQNYRTAEFSTMPRDCALLVEDGEVKKSLKYLRVNDSLERTLRSISALSKERSHAYWWETEVPVITPWALVDGVKITTSSG